MPVKEIIIARHAEALNKSIARRKGVLDSLRPLTKVGFQVQATALKKNKSWLKETQLLVHSPLVRAQETSRIILQHKRIQETLEFKQMKPHDDPKKLQQFLQKLNLKKVIVVGHDPHLTLLLKYLLSDVHGIDVRLKKSSLCYLKWNEVRKKYTLWGLYNPPSKPMN